MDETLLASRFDPEHAEDIALAAVKFSGRLLEYMPEYRANENLIRKAMETKKKGIDVVRLLTYASETVRDNHEFMVWAVTTRGGHPEDTKQAKGAYVNVPVRDFLKQASGRLLCNKYFVLDVMEALPKITFEKTIRGVVANGLLSDREFVMRAIQVDINVMRYVAKPLRFDRDFVIAAMKAVMDLDGDALKCKPGIHPARVVLFCSCYTIRRDAEIQNLLPSDALEGYLLFMTTRWNRVRKHWKRAIRVLLTIQRMQKDVEARDALLREADLAEAMCLGGAVDNGVENEKYMGLLRMAWDMGRAAGRAKRPREA